jgi:molybdenum cofactor synthesis domain-containing protein
MPTAAIVVIGDEILSGKFAEDNASWLVGELRELGVAVRHIQVVPDVVEDIAEAVRADAARFDHVFTSGGVGPTHDDVTMAGVALAFGVRVVRHPHLEGELRKHYGDHLLEPHLRMAEVPEGAELVPADSPSWPVTCMRNVYILPGVPSIFRRKLTAMRERFRARPFFSRRFYTMADEGAIAADLDAVVRAHRGIAIGSYPRVEATEYRVIVTLEAKDRELVDAAARDLEARLGDRVVKHE